MGQHLPGPPASPPVARRFLPGLLVLFIGSGCAALIYEIVWFQLLQLVIGSSAISLCVLLGTFMGGMCLGSLGLARFVSARRHPLRVYALLELGIGLIGLGILYGMPLADELYAASFGTGFWGILLRAAVCVVFLLPPTLLMGATLPAIARWIETTPKGISWLGVFYAGNIGGAVFGCLLAGFYLLRVHDVAIATFVAAAINAGVALLGLGLSIVTRHHSPAEDPRAERAAGVSGSWTVYVAIALSGACALSAEVVWTRLLSLLIGATVYTFSIILAVFLVGLGIGSSLGSLLARTTTRPRLLLGVCQLFLVAAIAWTAAMLARSLPYWPINPTLSPKPWFNFQLDLVRCLWAILPAAVLWGASFPLALAAVASPGQDPGRLVGRVYAANTVGAIAGAAAATLLLIPWLGTQQTQYVMIGLSGLAALLMMPPALVPFRARMTGSLSIRFGGVILLAAVLVVGVLMGAVAMSLLVRWRFAPDESLFLMPGLSTGEGLGVLGVLAAMGAVFLLLLAYLTHRAAPASAQGPLRTALRCAGAVGGAVIVAATATLLAWSVPPTPWELVAYGRGLPTRRLGAHLVFMGEGMNSSVAVTKEDDDTRFFHVSGKVEASTLAADMRLQRMLGHLPALLHPKPRSVLIVGCGAGVTAGCFVVHPEIERIVICEIEPLVPRVVATHFAKENYEVLKDKRVEVVYDDARHFILTTREKFDIITSDPIHPWVKGAATLYTREYFDLVKRHLNPGGLVTQWVPLYDSDLATVKSEIGTFLDAFPHGTIWSNDDQGKGYDTVLLGQVGEASINLDELQRRSRRPDHRRVAKSLQDVKFAGVIDLLATYLGQGSDLEPWLRSRPPAQINRDRNLRLQYLAGMGVNFDIGEEIHVGLLAYRRFPDALFTGSDASRELLRQRMEKTLGD
jgi:spermidine synthase